MPVFFRVVRRTPRGVEVIAEIHGPSITGTGADVIRERLIHFGYPTVSLQTALERFRLSAPTYIGFEKVEEE